MDKDLSQHTKDSKIKESINQTTFINQDNSINKDNQTNFIKQDNLANKDNPTNNDKTIGVVIPIYNVAPYLKECLDSVINQTYKNLSIVLVNDGSTDNNESLNIAKEYVARDSRFILIDKENGGLSSARNVGIEWFKNKYQTKLDSIESINVINQDSINIKNEETYGVIDRKEHDEFIENEKSNVDSKKDFSSISETKFDKGIELTESSILQSSSQAEKTRKAIHKIESSNNTTNKDSINTESNNIKTKLDSIESISNTINTKSLNNKANTTNQNTINNNSYNNTGGGGKPLILSHHK